MRALLRILLLLVLLAGARIEGGYSTSESASIHAGEAEAVPSSPADCPERAPHPSYPQLPLSLAREYKHGVAINADYPGLQLVHVSPSGAPLYIINGFLNATECDALVAKLASDRDTSVVYQLNREGVDKTTSRTSTHVRVTKAETPGLHSRIAELTLRNVANMESVRADALAAARLACESSAPRQRHTR